MFKVNDIIVCIDICPSDFPDYMKDIKTITKGKKYTVLEPSSSNWLHSRINKNNKNLVYIINDYGEREFFPVTRFKDVNKFRKFKLNKIVNRITNVEDIT